MFLFDYHVHTSCSFDSMCLPAEQVFSASKRGISELCFTDHIDFDTPEGMGHKSADLSELRSMVGELYPTYNGMKLKIGAEISLGNAKVADDVNEYVARFKPDFIIASIHRIDGLPVYKPEFYSNRTKHDAYFAYLNAIYNGICSNDEFDVIGHYDFITKYAPYADRSMHLGEDERIDETIKKIFRLLISRGQGIEINSSAWWNEACTGDDIIKLYTTLGGEFVTIGSDAHVSENVGNRLDEALEQAYRCGVKYVATYSERKPEFHKVERLM